MEKIIPRWEWRTFGKDLTRGETNIRKHPPGKTRESSEIYILSQRSNDNTKIRDELMDIKTLLRVNSDGLEQWTPIMKAGFPIHIIDLAVVYKAFNLKYPYFERDEYNYRQYLNGLIEPAKELRIVQVFKKRHGYTVNDCIVEIAEVRFDQYETKTIAVEHTNPELVIQTVRELELSDFENINYIKVMKQSVGMEH